MVICDGRRQIETWHAVGRPAAQHRLHVQLGLVRGARFAERQGHDCHRTGRRGTRVDHEPAAEAGPRRRADRQRAPDIRDAHARAGPDDRHWRDDLQKGVHDRRQGRRGQHGCRGQPQQAVVVVSTRSAVRLTRQLVSRCNAFYFYS